MRGKRGSLSNFFFGSLGTFVAWVPLRCSSLEKNRALFGPHAAGGMICLEPIQNAYSFRPGRSEICFHIASG